jgi:hypothetical protein
MKSRLLPLLVFLLLTGFLAFIADDVFWDIAGSPILHVFWFITLVVKSIPQWAFWTLLIVISLIVAHKSLSEERPAKQSSRKSTSSQKGPVGNWLSLLEQSKRSRYFKWSLAQALKRLGQDILLPQKALDPNKRENRRVRLGSDLPPEITAYLEARIPTSQRLPWRWLRRKSDPSSAALDLDPEIVVQYLENQIDPFKGEKGAHRT